MKKLALVVLSGGQDSTTCLALAVKAFGADHVSAITFNYGQRHSAEIEAAKRVAYLAGIPAPEIINIGEGILAGTSPLTDKSAQLETYVDFKSMDAIIGDRVEKTFVPMRNALFLTIAANRAEVMGAHTILTGVCQADNANYPDCRQQFIKDQQTTINEALGYGPGDLGYIRIDTPLMTLTKDQSIHKLIDHGGPRMFSWLAWSHTAYDGQYPPVGQDHASILRAEGFRVANWPDPLVVRAWSEGHMKLPDSLNYQNRTVVEAVAAMIPKQREALIEGGLLNV